ncbi:DNA cytosine methyltransferase [Tolypothrix sp. NIES-4075]|uniref:DNA cytosine methyltransferase n=1 Tax=Tolypothrix sp. NIES-4075 TaxID=2005459 RepID=UPI000B5C40F0
MGITQLDLCSGVGAGFCYAGLQLGFKLCGVAEIDGYCNDILFNRYPGVHNYGDVRSFAFEGGFGPLRCREIDIITASPPCPPFSGEGLRLGASDDRDCFPSILRILNNYQPKFAAIENVTGLLDCPTSPGKPTGSYFRGILRTLDSIGYDAEWLTIGSGHCGAPFIRERILLVAIARSLKLDWERTTPWTNQARRGTEEARATAKRRGAESGYPMSVVSNPGNLARPLGVKSGNGIIRKQRAAAGNLLDPRIAAIALNRILYLNSIAE